MGRRVEIQIAPLAAQLHDTWEDEAWKDVSFYIHRTEAVAGRRAYVAEKKRLDELAGTAQAPPAARALSTAVRQRQQAAAAASLSLSPLQPSPRCSRSTSSSRPHPTRRGSIRTRRSARSSQTTPRCAASLSRWATRQTERLGLKLALRRPGGAGRSTTRSRKRCAVATPPFAFARAPWECSSPDQARPSPSSPPLARARSSRRCTSSGPWSSPSAWSRRIRPTRSHRRRSSRRVSRRRVDQPRGPCQTRYFFSIVLPSVQCPDVPVAALHTGEPLSAGHGAGGEAAPAPAQRGAGAPRRAEASTMMPDVAYNKLSTQAIRMLRSNGGSALGSRCLKTLLGASQQDSYARGGGPPPDDEPQVKSTTFRYMLHCMMRGLDRDRKTCARIWDESSVTMRRWDEPPENDRGQESWAPDTMCVRVSPFRCRTRSIFSPPPPLCRPASAT